MGDNVQITAGSGTLVSTEEVTTLNGSGVSAQHLQRTANAIVLSDGTAIDLPGDSTYGLDVDVTRVSGTATVTATDLDIRDLVYTSDSVSIYGTATVTATDLDIRNLNQTQDAVKVGDGTSLIDIDTAPTDGETNGGKRLLHSEAWLWGYNGSTWDRLRSDTTNGLDVDVTRVSGNVTVVQPTAASLNATISGTAVVQDGGSSITVDQATASLLNASVIGATASDGALGTAYPVIAGMRASTAEPTAVSADGDAVALWGSRRGTLRVGQIRHSTLNADPYTLTAKSAQYTAQVTGTAFWTPASGAKIVITSFQIQTTGTTGGSVQLWFGASADTTYTRGTDLAIFDGDFIPSATSYPGVYVSGTWMSSTVDHVLRVTTSAAINTITVTCWGYEFTP